LNYLDERAFVAGTIFVAQVQLVAVFYAHRYKVRREHSFSMVNMEYFPNLIFLSRLVIVMRRMNKRIFNDAEYYVTERHQPVLV
jgi:hypothetical protein